MSLALLKELEQKVLATGARGGIPDLTPTVHPRQLFGIEIDSYAHELASMVVWIGYLQWKRKNGIPFETESPILEPLTNIMLMDAVLDLSDPEHPVEPEWPAAEVIVGNPPFLGGKLLRRGLGDDYVDAMFAVWDGRVRREADLCCYWHEKARDAIDEGKLRRAGLLATQSIRGGANRDTLQRIKDSGDIFFAVSDRKWILNGAAVQISMVGFDDGRDTRRVLDGVPVRAINPNLTADLDLTKAKKLAENAHLSFMGDTKGGALDITGELAAQLLRSPNANGSPNSDVVRPWVNGDDITSRPRGMWIVDFPPGTSEGAAALYERPFEYVKELVQGVRITNRRSVYRDRWWLHVEPRPEMRAALSSLRRFICTPRVSKHRLFVWLSAPTLADSATFVFRREDDYFFGVLHSHTHEVWARATGIQLREAESGFRYTPTTCFATFPFPWPPATEPRDIPVVIEIAASAAELDKLRTAWLNPPGLPESELRARTLTNLYNERPTWLVNAHKRLDKAVFAAYGWPDELTDQEILTRLLELNLKRSGA